MWGRRIALGLSLLTGCYSGVDNFELTAGLGDDGADGQGDADDAEQPNGWETGATPMRRLTRAQYLESTRELLVIPEWEPTGDLPDDGENGEEFVLPNLLAGGVTTTSSDFSRYRAAARGAAEAAFSTDEDLVERLGCTPTIPDDACVVEYLATSCERAFGRAVPEDDPVLVALVDVVRDGQQRLGSIRAGVSWAMVAVLQSPEFIYFYPEVDDDGEVDPYSRARGLALLMRDSVPDAELMAVARDGSLKDPEVVDAQVDRLVDRIVDDPAQRRAMQRFFDDWWGMGVIEAIGKNQEVFPEWDEALKLSMRKEIDAWIADILFERPGDFRRVLVGDRIFVNDVLADLYGIDGEFGEDVEGVELSADNPRSGLLSTGAFLAINAHLSVTSPSARGRFVLERLLCGSIGPVPDDVDPVIPPAEGPETTRERFEERHSEPACIGCHAMMDPPGFGLEEYDALGRYRREEKVEFDGEDHYLSVDTSGEINGVPFDDSKQMATVIADDPQFVRCVTQQVMRQALGREVTSDERGAIDELEQEFIDSGLDFIELWRLVAKHRVFTSFTEAE